MGMTRKLLPALLAAAALAGGTGGAAIVSATASPQLVTATPVAATTTRASTGSGSAVYRSASPGVVDVQATGVASSTPGPFGQPQAGSSTAEGSGFVLDSSGDIVTNEHVVAGASQIRVTFSDGSKATARVVGTDVSSDLAVLRVSVPSSRLHPLTLASSSGVAVGQPVYALGSPFGLSESLTSGIVSATGRSIQAPNQATIGGAIQTDAAINHGNSGGPLLDLSGNVIGVNAQIDSNSNDNAGVGFAIPIDATKGVADTVIAGKSVQHAYLGVQIADAASGAGAQVAEVKNGSPADKAGLQTGDVVTKIDGAAIENADDLTAKVSSYKPGDKATFTITRKGAAKTLDVTFGQRPS
jgi:putative serine protease PepD